MSTPTEPSPKVEAKSDDLGFDLPPPAVIPKRRLVAVSALALAALCIAFIFGWWPKHRARQALTEGHGTGESAVLRVQVVMPKVAESDRSVSLPGTIQPEEETVIYPRASGYVAKWNVDIGDEVKEDQLLAEIETPELDQQLLQARAQLAQAEAGLTQSKANAAFAKVSLARSEKLVENGLASQQDLDKAKAQAAVDEANVSVAEANIAAHRADIQRLSQLKGFARVKAPFSGRITARNVERGALVSAGTATPLFKLAAHRVMRVVVQVPQNLAPGIKADLDAKVSVREFPGRTFDARVGQVAGALDPMTRTMTTVVRLPNPEGLLLAGMYAEVAMGLPTPHQILELPATALLNDANGLRVAAVTPDNRVRLLPVTVERDTGPTIEIASGVEADQRVVALASADLVDGREVEVVAPPPAASAAK